METLNITYEQFLDLELVYCIFEENVEQCQFILDENNEFFIITLPLSVMGKFNSISYNSVLEMVEGHKVLVINCFNS
jgi:hypothetical protein